MTSLTNNKKESIAVPILFVPGIMGSRLTNEDGEIVWDPPPGGLSCKGIKALWQGLWDDADDRKQRLIGEPGQSFDSSFLRVAGLSSSPSEGEDKKHWRKVVTVPPGPEKIAIQSSQLSLPVALCSTAQPYKTRGWGTIHWESYGPFLQWLEQICTNITLKGVNCHVYLPIYACGYNWTASNADSAEGLSKWIKAAKNEMGTLGIKVDKILIISHSMGGFVSRYCAVETKRENDIHAICHIAMPDNGSPATYKRMKAGFEGIAKMVLGRNGKEVTAVLAHAPGGLELLPNVHYRQQDGAQGGWLTLEDKNESILLFQGKNPYNTVYKESHKWWRLINPDWVEPSKKVPKNIKIKLLRNKVFKGTLLKARDFHNKLKENKHANTWLIYSVFNAKVWDKVQWKLVQKIVHVARGGASTSLNQDANLPTPSLQALTQNPPLHREAGNGRIALTHEKRTATLNEVRIQPGTAAGDGTVHRGAGDHAINIVHYVPLDIPDDHQEIMNNVQVKDHVDHFIKTMLRNFSNCNFHDKCGM